MNTYPILEWRMQCRHLHEITYTPTLTDLDDVGLTGSGTSSAVPNLAAAPGPVFAGPSVAFIFSFPDDDKSLSPPVSTGAFCLTGHARRDICGSSG
jgi:hypothetical protein